MSSNTIGPWGTSTGTVDATPTNEQLALFSDLITENIKFPPGVGSPDWDSVADFFNTCQSSGRISGGVVTAHAGPDGTVDISELVGLIRKTNALDSELVFFKMAAQASLALTDNNLNYLYLDYNSGAPAIKATTDRTTIHEYDNFTVGRVYRSGTAVDIVQSGTNIYNAYRRIHNRLIKRYGFHWCSGSAVAESDTRKLSVTDGVWYMGNTEIDVTGYDTNVSGDFSTYYLTGSTWTKTTGVTQLGNTQYNDVVSGLVALGVSKFANYWVYLCPQGELYVVYGQVQYNSLAEAQAAQSPASLPDYLVKNARLVARISWKQGATNFSSITNANLVNLPASSAVTHNNLGGLQGGTSSEYYHLTNTQHTALSADGSTTGSAGSLKSNATTGLMQIVGPAAGATRVVTIPDVNCSMARKDVTETFAGRILCDDTTDATSTTDGSLQTDGGLSVAKKAVIGGTLFCSTNTIDSGSIELNSNGTGDRNSYIDLHTDDTNTDYGLRVIKIGGINGLSQILGRGTAGINISAVDAAPIYLKTTDITRITIAAGGDISIASTTETSSSTTGALVVPGGIGVGGGIFAGGNVNVASGKVYKVNGTQVLGAQGAAVADATGAGDVVAQLNALLARLRSHGIIAT